MFYVSMAAKCSSAKRQIHMDAQSGMIFVSPFWASYFLLIRPKHRGVTAQTEYVYVFIIMNVTDNLL